ncbi:uncharacterized protein [Onthophagus taurus]|uniref:uncharacterized protein n=1 Tax=Onthophagus taurus TaxID=166361 RepID=UPI0039BDF9D7
MSYTNVTTYVTINEPMTAASSTEEINHEEDFVGGNLPNPRKLAEVHQVTPMSSPKLLRTTYIEGRFYRELNQESDEDRERFTINIENNRGRLPSSSVSRVRFWLANLFGQNSAASTKKKQDSFELLPDNGNSKSKKQKNKTKATGNIAYTGF